MYNTEELCKQYIRPYDTFEWDGCGWMCGSPQENLDGGHNFFPIETIVWTNAIRMTFLRFLKSTILKILLW